ncbi:MAG: hypothetical protein JRH11_10850, partial [Deltaproteobacteria bacterium]|nr:hypothetical protein [Deltaproteobacteria bacterium]
MRLRAGAFYAIRCGVALLGAGLLAFAMLSLAVGPVASMPVAAIAWALSALAAGLGAFWALRGARKLVGSGVTSLFAAAEGAAPLASASRSAVELGRDPRAQTLAPDLVAAHAARVTEALSLVPIRRVVPFSFMVHPAPLLGALGIALASLLLHALDRSAAGAFALTHPGVTDAGGTRIAAVVSRVDARLVFPGYLNLPPATLRDVTTIEAPRGTSIELTVTPRIAATGGVVIVGATAVQLSRHDDATLTARLVVREDGELTVSLDDTEGTRLKDPRRRAVRILSDLAPEVVLLAPAADPIVELDEDVPVMWEAADDVGLKSVDLVIEAPDGREIRRRVHRDDGGRETEARGGQFIVARAFGAQAGDRLRVWVEARDGDEVSGPNVGKSEVRTVTVASEATRRAAALEDLNAVLGRGLDALADRLETAVPREDEAALTRYARVRASHHAFASSLEDLSAGLGAQAGQRAASSLYREMARRSRRLITRGARAHGRRPAPFRRRQTVDNAAVAALEADTLLLADSLSRAQL